MQSRRPTFNYLRDTLSAFCASRMGLRGTFGPSQQLCKSDSLGTLACAL